MRRILHRARRSSTGRHHLLPAAGPESRGPSLVSISTLFAWTFGSGAVFWRIWPAVLLHTLFATAVTVLELRTQMDLGISNVMMTVLGVVIGFVISYRASGGYDQYWMGRKAWSDVVKNTQTLMRFIWFHVPLRLTPKTPAELAMPEAPRRSKEEMEKVMTEKRAALDLLEGFAFALKHHLRGEPGILYTDLYHLVKPLHEHRNHRHAHGIVSKAPTANDQSWHARGRSERDPLIPKTIDHETSSLARSPSDNSAHSVTPTLSPASHDRDHVPSLLGRVSADLIPFASHTRDIFGFLRSREVPETQFGIDIDGRGGVQRRWATGVPALGPNARKRIARGDENIPVEILRLLSDWFAVLEERGTVPGTTLGNMIATVAMMDDSLNAAESVLTTPLPFVYAVHIRTVWLYLFFLPFQLVAQFSWYTIPGVAMAAFIYLGFLAAGDEIGQPFGYDENDLDLDLICREMIHADFSRLKKTSGLNVYLGPHHDEVTPHA